MPTTSRHLTHLRATRPFVRALRAGILVLASCAGTQLPVDQVKAPGDLHGESKPVANDASGVNVRIDSVIP